MVELATKSLAPVIGLVPASLSIVELVVNRTIGTVASWVKAVLLAEAPVTEAPKVRYPSLRALRSSPVTDHVPSPVIVAVPDGSVVDESPSETVTVTVKPTALALVPDTVIASSSRLLM